MDSLIIAIAGGFALLLALAVFFTLRAGRKKKRNMHGAQQIKGQQQRQQPGRRPNKEAAQQGEKPEVPGEIVLTETREQGIKRQVKEFASTNPEIVAQLLRTWMKEDDTK
jgi:flagellar biosynthesis/type III secretory pathway M-ring protein FliF/YscJ